VGYECFGCTVEFKKLKKIYDRAACSVMAMYDDGYTYILHAGMQ
jgi:hypothetical protein